MTERPDMFPWDRWVSRDSKWWMVWYVGTAYGAGLTTAVLVLLVVWWIA